MKPWTKGGVYTIWLTPKGISMETYIDSSEQVPMNGRTTGGSMDK
jgi:hypothetical protein